MNTHGYWLAGLAAFVFTASFGAVCEQPTSDALRAGKAELVAEISASTRDALRSVTPEITLPAVQIEAPALLLAKR